MTMNRSDREETNMAESADRRQFLRNAMKIGGAAALLLTSASRQVLAQSLQLNSQDMDAARRAQLAQGAPAAASQSGEPVSSGYHGCDCSGCSGCTGTCSDSCGNKCTSCTGGCQGTCAGGCSDSCKGSAR